MMRHGRHALGYVVRRSVPLAGTEVAVLIPAHNEADSIQESVASVAGHRVIVVADNCTDDTVELARKAGAEVFITVNNTGRKAGALNQALGWLLKTWNSPIMMMDADSAVGEDFIAVALQRLATDYRLGAVGGVFYATRSDSLVEALQANEYQRYSRSIAINRDSVSVLSGTAAVFRASALRQLIDKRGYAYEPTALTEDNEMTLAIKSLGWRLISPQRCTVRTQVMPRWRDLYVQRLRWYRGAIDNLTSYGWTPVTAKYWRQQLGLAASTLAVLLYLALMVWSAANGTLRLSTFWAIVGVLFAVERVGTVWRQGVSARILAALIIPEMVYDIFLQYIFIRAVSSAIARREVRWVHPVVTN